MPRQPLLFNEGAANRAETLAWYYSDELQGAQEGALYGDVCKSMLIDCCHKLAELGMDEMQIHKLLADAVAQWVIENGGAR